MNDLLGTALVFAPTFGFVVTWLVLLVVLRRKRQ